MAYLDIITLEEAKNYLRVDSTLTEDDAQITLMIKAALRYVEKRTNIMLIARDKDYVFDVSNMVRVYDYPINSIVAPTEQLEATKKSLYTSYCYSGSTETELTLNVGYTLPADAREEQDEIIGVAYEIISLLYYQGDTNDSIDTMMGAMSREILDINRRFVL